MTQATSMLQRFMGPPKQDQPKAGKPLELVSYDTEKKRFEVGKEALAVLRATRGPVGVISVCGRARQGKSFILNQLLGQSSGFTVAPTHRPCTKGLWMWSSPQERVNVDGSKSYLVMLDTEGIDAWDQTGQYSVQIFSLAVLLSSLFVYNQMGGIDEAAVDRLSLVTEMTKHIRVRAGASKGEASESELAQFTPSFLWLLRDFYLELVEDGRTVSPKEYLETALASTPETSTSAKAKNSIRESIKHLFPDRDCFPLVRPISDEAKLARLEAVPVKELRPEFREGLSKLTELCFRKAQPKQVGRTVITGPMLAGLVTAYVDAINGGAVPNIATAWQGVAEAECRRAADAAEQEYHRVINHDVAADPESLLAEHQRALDAAKAVFEQEAIGDTEIKGAVEKKWRESVEQAFKHIKDKRLAQASQGVATLLNDMTTQLTQKSADTTVTTADLMRSVKASLADYMAKAEGPSKWPKLVEHLQTALAVIVKRVEGDAARGVDAAQRATTDLKAELATAQGEVARLRASAGSEESKARALEAQLEAAHQKAATDADRVRTQLQADIESQARRMETQVTAAQAVAAAAQAEKGSTQDQVQRLEGEKASIQRQLDEVSAQLNQERAKANELETKGTVATAEADGEVVQERLAALATQLTAEKKRVAELLAEKEAQAAALQEMQQQTEREVAQHAMQQRDSMGDDAGPAGMDVDPVGADGPRAEGLTIQEIKEWLTDNGHEDACWTLANRKAPRVKKAEWVALMNSKQA